ncbi:MAG: indolepyruvate ferredoxin oxidoreductase [Candidatus Aminicenantes bacterium]|nr:MAG: indolepyruvate ferredoxin oxidoreductase [Candidatus Aminicenantes bacterium]
MSEKKILLLGDEAIARAGIDAGVSGFYAYPGTPSTEIMEYVQHSGEAAVKKIHRQWSANEKTAMEAALGMSYAGKRAMAAMKHVGLNVAADPFINSGITGANGGLIVVAADDPSMHSSQNEQDSRFFGTFALIPILEPSAGQEAYDMVFYGYELSEKYKIPVLLRISTRLAHSRSGVVTREPLPQKELKLPENKRQYVLLPALARKSYKRLLNLQEKFLEESEQSSYNRYLTGTDKRLGIIACGLGYNYLRENFAGGECPYPVVKIGQYPPPKKMIARLVDECEEILVIEEGQPLLEERLRGLLDRDVQVRGRLSGDLSRDGELSPNLVRIALGMADLKGSSVPGLVVPRPPTLCKGCPHVDTYLAINEAVKDIYGDGHVFSDIGCYTLGALPPYESINSCVDMGASISMAKGAADAGFFPSCCVIGDSTFTHSGMTPLLDAVIEKSNIVVFIADNSTTAMTGGQATHAYKRLESICLGLGIEKEHFHIINPIPKNHEEFVNIIKKEIEYNGPSVIVPTRECVQVLRKRSKKK